MRAIFESIKEGFDIALSELFAFLFKLVSCLYLCALPTILSAALPLVIVAVATLLGIIEDPRDTIIFKIVLSLSQVVALSMSMSLLASEEAVDERSTKYMLPSRDLVIAIYVLVNIYIWK
jgi:hypothetical protein